MKGFIMFLACCSVILGSLFVFDKAFPQQFNNFINYSPCNTPVAYRIGTVDPKFNLSRDEFAADVTQAANLWSQAEGKNLFIYNPNAPLHIDLIYDQRQALTTQINQLQNQVKNNQGALDQQIADYKAKEQDFTRRLQALNQEIDSWNAKGGAPEDVFNQLIQKQKELRAEGENLNAEAQSLNLSTEQYNTQVGVLNQNITTFSQALSQKPEEGLYDPQNESITIYFDNGQAELIHTLAHELGHSLGLGHDQDPKAIMYPYTNTNTTITNADLQELNHICQTQTLQYRIQTNTSLILHQFTAILHPF